MSIIDKARALAKQIRFDDEEYTPNTNVFAEGADMIDALCVELESKLAQPEQSPVAWIEHHKAGDNLNWEQCAASDTPLYTQPKAPEDAATVRNAALEEAAKVCEQFTHYGEASGIICVKAIRELKEVQS